MKNEDMKGFLKNHFDLQAFILHVNVSTRNVLASLAERI